MIKEPMEDTIRAYLKGKFSKPERLAFEAEMDQDASLAEKVNLLATEMAAAEWLIAEENRVLFAQWKQEKKQNNPRWINGKPLGFLVFALVFFIAVVAFWFFQQNQPAVPTPAPQPVPVLPQAKENNNPVATEEPKVAFPELRQPERNYLALAKQQYNEPVLSTVRRAQTDSTQTPLILAREAYAAGNYAQALVLLNQVDSTRRQSADFLSANALFHLGKYREAETTFENLVKTGSTQYRYSSEWSLLVCRLAQLPARKDAFEKQLEEIQKRPDHPYFLQAKNLQKDLNK